MRKREELTDPASCMSRARDDEMTFVLLSRDEDAPGTVRDWMRRRVRRGKNRRGDATMANAEQIAAAMLAERGGAEAATPAATKEAFVDELLHLMRLHGVEVDHNHDAEALGDGWHFAASGFRAGMGEIYRRQTEGA